MHLNIYILFILSLLLTSCGDTNSQSNTDISHKQPKDTTKMIHAIADDETDWTWFVGTDVEYKSPKLVFDTYFTQGLPTEIGHLQYFLDTDNNPNTGFSTGKDSWKISGADYLIEDGDLYKSESTTNWKWTYIGKFDNYTKSVENNITQLHISTNNQTISSMIKANTIHITIEPFDKNWGSSYSTISTQSVTLDNGKKSSLQKKIIEQFCSEEIYKPTEKNIEKSNTTYNSLNISKKGDIISIGKTKDSRKYCQTELEYKYWSCDFKDIDSAIMPFACDWLKNKNKTSKDKAIDLLHLWSTLELYDKNSFQLKIFNSDKSDWKRDIYIASSQEFSLPIPKGSPPIKLHLNEGTLEVDAIVTNSEVKVNWKNGNQDNRWIMLLRKDKIYETGFPWASINGKKGDTSLYSYNSDYIYKDAKGTVHPRNFPNYYSNSIASRKAAAILADILPENIKEGVKNRLYRNSLLYDVYNEDFSKFFKNSDYMNTLAEGLLTYLAFYEADDIIKDEKLNIYKNYLEIFIKPSSNRVSVFKPDGTGHHHYMHYNTYMYALNPYINILNLLANSDYQVSLTTFNFLRRNIFTITNMSNPFDELPFLSGRHPFRGYNPIWSTSFQKLINLDNNYELDDNLMKRLSDFYNNKQNLNIEGFWQYNYGVTGIYREKTWLTGIIGVGSTFPAGETSPNSSGKNMYGRYQGYGTLMTLYKGRNKLWSANHNSGFAEYGKGWDWNRWPGTTSVVLPWNKLLYKSYDYELNKKDFAGTLRFNPTTIYDGGSSGMFAMDFQQSEGVGFKDQSFMFKKSAFFYDGKILMLGSNIENSGKYNNFETVTTLFQNILLSKDMNIEVEGDNISIFPYEDKIQNGEKKHLIDAYGTGYYILSNSQINIKKLTQHTPSLDNKTATEQDCKNSTTKGTQNCFNDADSAIAEIIHGKAPTSGNYAYVVVPSVDKQIFNQYNADEITIIRQDSVAHVVKLPNNLTGYAIFKPDTIIGDQLIKKVNEPVLIMEQQNENEREITLVDPFLNYHYHDNHSLKPNTKSQIILTLNGEWNLKNNKENKISIISNTNNTTQLSILVQDGLPADFTLEQK